jgi:hypothetical protein
MYPRYPERSPLVDTGESISEEGAEEANDKP